MRIILIQVLFIVCCICTNSLSAQSDRLELFTDCKVEEISDQEYSQIERAYIASKKYNSFIDSAGYIPHLNLYLIGDCNEICEDYLYDPITHDSLNISVDYDQGFQGLLFSPSGNQLIIFASYDGPDYADYYYSRAVIYTYKVNSKKEGNTLRAHKQYSIFNWSIENLFWIDEDSIVLKVYKGGKSTTGLSEEFQFFSVILDDVEKGN